MLSICALRVLRPYSSFPYSSGEAALHSTKLGPGAGLQARAAAGVS